MLGGHLPELLILLVVALIIFGPKRLPEIGSSLGKSIKGFKQQVSDIEDHHVAQPVVVAQPAPQAVTAPVTYIHPENEVVSRETVTREPVLKA